MRKFFSLIAAVLFAGSMMATTVTKTVEELATANSWANGTVVTPFALDEVISVSTEATDANTGKYYTSGQQIRLYQTGAAKMIISAAEGYTISSITVEYVSEKGGIFAEAASGVAVPFENVQSATFTVANSGEATNGQARVTSISVTYDGGAVPPTPTVNYYVAGSMGVWGPDEAYRLTPSNNGEYEGEFTFAANDEFKVIGYDGTTVTWFPEGMDNNYVITEAGDYKITFNPAGNVEGWYAGFFNVVKKEAPIVHQYEVAEAIAAGLQEDDEVLVRGIITKMEFKGKNFAKYGSVNIYVADATGAEGEFEFYNCYSLEADTFRTSTPAYDPASTAWAQFREVVDGNGNAIHVGDTVIAFGKYKLYNSTHELNTGCYLVDIKHAPVAPAEDINVNMSDGLRYDDYVASEGWWQIYGSDEHFVVSISNVSTTQAEGTYTIADLDADYTYLGVINGADTTYISFVDGSVTLSIEAQTGNVTVAGTLVGDDGNNYIFNLQYIVPTPQETVNVNIQNATLIDVYADYGLYGAYGTDANGISVQLAIWAEAGFQGQFTEEDLDVQYLGSGLMIGEEFVEIYTAAITVTPGNGGDYNITATLLCYNNKQYNVTMYISGTEGIEDVEAVVKAVKSIVNGQLLIEKDGKTYNAAGQLLK